MKISIDDDADLIKKLQEGSEEVLRAVYKNNEASFINWACHHFSTDETQAKDVFQLAVITLYRNAREKKLQQLTCTVKTYVFAIGKRLLLKLKKKELRAAVTDIGNPEVLEIPDEVYANLVDAKKVARILSQVGEPCKSILEKFYFHSLSMEEIAVETGYKSEGVIRKKKHQCMQKIREIIKTGGYTINDFLEV
jgi:RNA polymerase sigma factor (sigma-70 family)